MIRCVVGIPNNQEEDFLPLRNNARQILNFFCTMNNTIHKGMSDAEYRSHVERVSAHDTMDFSKNPYGYFRKKEAGVRDEPTDAMRLGTAVHSAVLTPKIYTESYVVLPGNITRRAGKAWEAFSAENAGKEILKQEEADMIGGISDAIYAHKNASEILSWVDADDMEVSLFYELGGLECKSRLDFVVPEDGIVGDLKTAADASPEGFMKACDAFQYDVQAAMYMRAAEECGLKADHFVFIAVENKFPFTVGVYSFSRNSEFIRAGELEVNKRLADMRRWADGTLEHPAGWVEHDLALPAWSKRLQALRKSGGIPF